MSTLFRMVRGVVAGAVAGVVLKKVDEFIRGKQSTRSPSREGEPEKILRPELRAVERLSETFSVEMDDEQKEAAANIMKFAMMAIVSTVSRSIRSHTSSKRGPILGGALFGVLSYIVVDQVIHPLLGFSRSPFNVPTKDHLREAAAHAVSGIADNATRQILLA